MELDPNHNHGNNNNDCNNQYVVPSKDCRIFEVEDIKNVNYREYIVLQSNEEKPVQYQINRNASKMSGLINDILLDDQNDQNSGSGEETIIPLPNVDGKTLAYVIQYMDHHWNNKANPIEKPLKGKVEEVVSKWDRDFLNTDLVQNGVEEQHELLIAVIMAANFMNIKDLLELGCAKIASMIRGKTPEQIRKLFNIENDFTPEEEEKIREENRWCMEEA